MLITPIPGARSFRWVLTMLMPGLSAYRFPEI